MDQDRIKAQLELLSDELVDLALQLYVAGDRAETLEMQIAMALQVILELPDDIREKNYIYTGNNQH